MKFIALTLIFSLVKGLVDSPLTLCGRQSEYLFLTNVELIPYPLIAGQELNVKVTGRLHTNLTEGGTANVVAKLGPVPVLKTAIDLCADSRCPIGKDDENDQSMTIKQSIPPITPRGKLWVTIKVNNGNGLEMACLQGRLEVIRD